MKEWRGPHLPGIYQEFLPKSPPWDWDKTLQEWLLSTLCAETNLPSPHLQWLAGWHQVQYDSIKEHFTDSSWQSQFTVMVKASVRLKWTKLSKGKKAKVCITVPSGWTHLKAWQKDCCGERGEMRWTVQMGITAKNWQSILEGIHVVALGCTCKMRWK